MIIRVPHSPQNEVKSIWSISLSWSVTKNATDMYCDGFTQSDLEDIKDFLSECRPMFRHPYAFLVFLVQLLDAYYTRMMQALGTDIDALERKLGITRGTKGFHGWDWKPDILRAYTQDCYRLTSTPVWLERRFVFLISLCKFILECVHTLERELSYDFPGKEMVMSVSPSLIEALTNDIHLANGQLHQTRCLEKRLHNLMSTVRSHYLCSH